MRRTSISAGHLTGDSTEDRKTNELSVGLDSSTGVSVSGPGHGGIDLDGKQRESPFNRKLLNVVLLGMGFCFWLGSVQACMLAQTVILNSISDEYFVGTPTVGYFLLALNFVGMGISFVLSPAFAAVIGPKRSLIGGAACAIAGIASMVRPLEATLYLGSAIQGLGMGTIWTVYGHFLTENSTEKTLGRNTGIFWMLFNIGTICMNLFYFMISRGSPTITSETRYLFLMVLLPWSLMGIVCFAGLDCQGSCFGSSKSPKIKESISLPVNKFKAAKGALRDELKMALTKDMILLIPTFIFMGIQLAVLLNVYSTSLGYSRQYGDLRESLVGLHGVFQALGQIAGGLTYALLGGWIRRNGRYGGLLLALLVSLMAFTVAFLVLPGRAAFEMTSDHSTVAGNPYVAMLGSFLVGFGDAAWNNSIFSLLGSMHPANPIAALAIFQAYQSLGNVIAFGYSGFLTIPFHGLTAGILAVIGAFCFFVVERKKSTEVSKQKVLELTIRTQTLKSGQNDLAEQDLQDVSRHTSL